jgi:hypothetical protein
MPWIAKDKIAIMGGSYGGYMVAACLAFQPDVFDAGINIFGVTNWTRTLQSIPPLVGRDEGLAVRRDGRSSDRRRAAPGDLALVPRQEHQKAAARRPGRERSAGAAESKATNWSRRSRRTATP